MSLQSGEITGGQCVGAPWPELYFTRCQIWLVLYHVYSTAGAGDTFTEYSSDVVRHAIYLKSHPAHLLAKYYHLYLWHATRNAHGDEYPVFSQPDRFLFIPLVPNVYTFKVLQYDTLVLDLLSPYDLYYIRRVELACRYNLLARD